MKRPVLLLEIQRRKLTYTEVGKAVGVSTWRMPINSFMTPAVIPSLQDPKRQWPSHISVHVTAIITLMTWLVRRVYQC